MTCLVCVCVYCLFVLMTVPSPPLPSLPMQIGRDSTMFAPDPQPLSSLREFRSEVNLARMTNFDPGEWAGTVRVGVTAMVVGVALWE